MRKFNLSHLKAQILVLIFILATAFSIGLYFFSQPVKEKIDSLISPKPPEKIYASTITNVEAPFNANLEIKQPVFPDTVCDISMYGAIADGKTKNTKAFSDAIADCDKKGGGMVLVPAGTWFTGAIHLTNNINLHLEKDAIILFSTEESDYLPVVPSRYEGVNYMGLSPFIYANNCHNVAVTGEGTLDGQGEVWWPRNTNSIVALYQMGKDNKPLEKRVFADEKLFLRPSFIQLNNCDSILLSDFNLKDSPMWTIHPLYSSNIIIRNVNVNTLGLNTDGIAIDSSRNVLVDNAIVRSGDDAIVIKSGRDSDGLRTNKPSENIVIRNCQVYQGHGGVAIGSEVSGGIRNVSISNLKIDKTTSGVRIKSTRGRGGIVENIWVDAVDIRRSLEEAIQIDMNYDVGAVSDSDLTTKLRNINLSNITCKGASVAAIVHGFSDDFIDTVSLKNITVFASRNGMDIFNVKNLTLSNLIITPRIIPALNLTDTQNVSLEKINCVNLKTCLMINGSASENIDLSNSGLLRKSTKMKLDANVNKDTIIFND
jgi:polygalacturonase